MTKPKKKVIKKTTGKKTKKISNSYLVDLLQKQQKLTKDFKEFTEKLYILISKEKYRPLYSHQYSCVPQGIDWVVESCHDDLMNAINTIFVGTETEGDFPDSIIQLEDSMLGIALFNTDEFNTVDVTVSFKQQLKLVNELCSKLARFRTLFLAVTRIPEMDEMDEDGDVFDEVEPQSVWDTLLAEFEDRLDYIVSETHFTLNHRE